MLECQKKAKAKWAKENTYTKQIRFYKNKLPIEIMDKAIENIRKDGNTFHNFISEKLKEMGER